MHVGETIRETRNVSTSLPVIPIMITTRVFDWQAIELPKFPTLWNSNDPCGYSFFAKLHKLCQSSIWPGFPCGFNVPVGIRGAQVPIWRSRRGFLTVVNWIFSDMNLIAPDLETELLHCIDVLFNLRPRSWTFAREKVIDRNNGWTQ